MNVAFYPPTKGGVSKTSTIWPKRFSSELLLAARLAYQEGGYEQFQSVLTEMRQRYFLSNEMAMSLGDAAGKCSTALALLDEGLPVDYILAMGGSDARS